MPQPTFAQTSTGIEHSFRRGLELARAQPPPPSDTAWAAAAAETRKLPWRALSIRRSMSVTRGSDGSAPFRAVQGAGEAWRGSLPGELIVSDPDYAARTPRGVASALSDRAVCLADEAAVVWIAAAVGGQHSVVPVGIILERGGRRNAAVADGVCELQEAADPLVAVQ